MTARPRALRRGDTVAVVAPAGPWERRSQVLRGVAGLEAWGLNVRLGDHVDDRRGYLAGRDENRAADLHAAFADPDVAGIVCLRGGYGSQRIVPMLDRDLIRANPKVIAGYSDITILHLALQRWTDWITLYSYGLTGVGTVDGVSELSRESMRRALFGEEPGGWDVPRNPEDPYVRTIVGGSGRGRITGGCLTLVARTLATPIEIETEGRILFLEDVDVRAYEVDGLLTQLRDAGKLESCAGIVISDTVAKHSGALQELSLEDVLEDVLAPLGVPCIYGLPLGHEKHHITLPIGAMATLDADAGRLVIQEGLLPA